MKRIFLILLITAVVYQSSFPQDNRVEEVLYSPNNDVKIVKFVEGKFIIPADSSVELIKKYFKVPHNNDFKVRLFREDKLGIKHARYMQLYKGISVETAEVIVHYKNGQVLTMNGNISHVSDLNTNPKYSPDQALNITLDYINSKKYAWEDQNAETWIKQRMNNKQNSFYPNPELVIWNQPFDHNCFLAYRIEVFSIEPFFLKTYYLDANSGNILHIKNLMNGSDVIGTAETRYSGTVNLHTESIQEGYRLRDISRGDGIETKNCETTNDIWNAGDFLDANNDWDEYDNENMDDAALDAHFAAQKTYDYFKNTDYIERDSYDGDGSKIRIFVHFDDELNNSYWLGGAVNAIVMGDGDGVSCSPLTSLDASTHEFGHGVTLSYLSYVVETGECAAVREGISDAWGACLETYVNIQGNEPWLVGEDYQLQANHALDLNDPNNSHYHIENNLQNPAHSYTDTYHGTNWYFGSSDNYGEHYNSTVFSHWFNLLAKGRVDTNEDGRHYVVCDIGISKAAKILYNYYEYITPAATYEDACWYTTYIATQLYGSYSNEAIQTWNAWYAVGLWPVEATNLISGNANICSSVNTTYSLPPELDGATITWSKSNNISILSGQGTTSITVTKNESYPEGEGTITVVYNHGSGNKTATMYPWVGLPELPTTYPAGYPPIEKELYDILTVNLDDCPGADPFLSEWSAEGSLEVLYPQALIGQYYCYEENELAVFYLNTRNVCGLSPTMTGYAIITAGGGEKAANGHEGFLWTLSPNPTSTYITITLENNNIDNLEDSYDVGIIDSNSRTRINVKLYGPSNRIYIQNLEVGFYAVRLRINGKIYSKPLIIQK